MAKKPSGLGRGLEDLLEDNAMTKRQSSKPLVESKGEATPAKASSSSAVYEVKPKALYETKPKTKSLKANFKNLK